MRAGNSSSYTFFPVKDSRQTAQLPDYRMIKEICLRYSYNLDGSIIDGVAKSPSSGVAARFQDFDILICMPSPLKNHYAL